MGATIFSSYIWPLILTFGTAMVPVLELRGAIPFGVVAMGLPMPAVYIVSVLGNMVPVPFIILFIRRIFQWLSKRSERFQRLVARLEARAFEKAELIYKYELIGLVILVAIPLPGTGAWTGALIAALLSIRMKAAVPCILAGVLIAGLIVCLAVLGVVNLVV